RSIDASPLIGYLCLAAAAAGAVATKDTGLAIMVFAIVTVAVDTGRRMPKAGWRSILTSAFGFGVVLAALVASTRHSARVTEALAGPQSAIVLVDDLDAGIAFSNAYAPEHLEVVTADAAAVAARTTSAGAIFVGPYAPVSLGDYLAGSNHVLPTGGQARYGSGLGAHTFLRPQQLIEYDRTALQAVAEKIVALADAEALPAHGEAVQARFATNATESTSKGS
ncbi:MAG TPA: histidinol dehydrogenase, partial [Microbacteriaceae bacterium]|nr:histidinol dehydrogenase [Microbacteriaceae bacterium]